MNRRVFLDPRRLLANAGQVLGALDDLSTPVPAAATEPIDLLRFSRRAMATTFEVVVPYGTPLAYALAESALDEIDRLEDQLTVYRDTSEVSRLNRLASEMPVAVEERLFGLLELAFRLWQETEGAIDITNGALTKAWGFFRRCGRVPSPSERQQVLTQIGMRHLVLERETRAVRCLQPGLEINLGSIGKGYALDRAASMLRDDWGLSAAVLHGGHSSIYALGSAPGDGRGWPVGVQHPWDAERRLAMIRLRDKGLATSAATFQHVEFHGRKLGHILDPRTGWPAEGMASVTVIAPTAAEADALATAFFILGVNRTRAYCAAHPGIGALLLPDSESARPLVVGLSPQEIHLLP